MKNVRSGLLLDFRKNISAQKIGFLWYSFRISFLEKVLIFCHPQNLSSGQRHILMRQWWQSFKINELLLFLGSWVSHWICATDASKWPRLIWWPVSRTTPPNIRLSLFRYGLFLPRKMKHPILFKSWAKSVTDLMRCETGGDGEAPTASREKLPPIAIARVAFYF